MQDLHENDVIDAVAPTAPTDGEDVEAIAHLLGALERGVDWPTAILQNHVNLAHCDRNNRRQVQ